MRKGERFFLAAFGAFLLWVGIFGVLRDDLSLPWRLLGGGGLALLGSNALISAWRGRQSWLARLGPLP